MNSLNLCTVFFACFGLSCVSSQIINFTTDGDTGSDLKEYLMFKTQDAILSYYHSKLEQDPRLITSILHRYRLCFPSPDVPVTTGKRRPFIVVEGYHRPNRMVLAKGLADALGGRYIFTPPKCLINFTGVFPRTSTDKNAFFALSLYASAYNARQLLALDCPVVLNGYWSEQAEFIISKLFKRKMDLPPIGDPVYDIPSDLMAPDIVILYDSPYYGPLKDSGFRAPPKKLVVYNNFRMGHAEFMFIRYETNITETVYRVLSMIKKKFDHVFNFGPAFPKYLVNI